jgi:hypothetical protein
MTERPPLNRPALPDSVRKFVEDAPGAKQALEEPAAPAPKGVTLDADSIRALMPRAVPTKALNMRVPLDLYEDLKFLSRMTDANMTEVVIEGARAEVKKRLAAFNKG